MPMVSPQVSCPVTPTFRVRQIASMFDLPLSMRSEMAFHVEIPGPDEDWTIGAIVGPSGSGKSTVARAAFGEQMEGLFFWPPHEAVIDGFDDAPIKTITRALAAVGFSSPPAWLRPYRVLSRGERFRCDLARALLAPGPVTVCDEYSSLVDRTVAQVGSAALAKALRRGRFARKFVAVTCHADVLPWLEADWVADMATSTLTWGRLRRPPIELTVQRVRQAEWRRFARHHYLSGALARGATCYVARWREEPVAFCAVIRSLGARRHKRVTRLVTLPDYQGLGIGTRLLEYVGERVLAEGERYGVTTAHPGMCDYLLASPRWLRTRVRRSYRPSRQQFRGAPVRDSGERAVASFEFLG